MLSDGTERLTRIRYLELASLAKAFKEARDNSPTHRIACDAINDLMDEVDALMRDLAIERRAALKDDQAETTQEESTPAGTQKAGKDTRSGGLGDGGR